MKLSQVKLFTFNASSFPLDPSVEGFLKSKGAVTLDFGTLAYVNSETMPAILLELVEKAQTDVSSNVDLVAQLKAEVGRYSAERQKIIEENTRLGLQAKSYSAEVAALREQAAAAIKTVEALKAENARLQLAAKNVPVAPSTQPAMDDKMRQSYERLQRDLQALRAQNADALASLKVLEVENDDLMRELEKAKSESRNAAAPKA